MKTSTKVKTITATSNGGDTDESTRELRGVLETYIDHAKSISDSVLRVTTFLSVIEHKSKDQNLRKAAREELETWDRNLARITMFFIHVLRYRAPRSDSHDLLLHTIGQSLSLAHELPGLLDKYTRICRDDLSDPDNFVAQFGDLMCALTHRLEQLTETHPDALQPAASDYPYWPVLQFKNASANNHFPLLADRIKLGQACVVQSSDHARYSFQTPINRYVWEILLHFHFIHRTIGFGHNRGESVAESLSHQIGSPLPDERIEPEEVPIYERSYRLPALTKANASSWADCALMPYIRLKTPDLRQVAAFKHVDTGPRGRRYAAARKVVIQALRSLAKNP